MTACKVLCCLGGASLRGGPVVSETLSTSQGTQQLPLATVTYQEYGQFTKYFVFHTFRNCWQCSLWSTEHITVYTAFSLWDQDCFQGVFVTVECGYF